MYTREYFGCECNEVGHVIEIGYFKDDDTHDPEPDMIFVGQIIDPWRMTFVQRIKMALSVIFKPHEFLTLTDTVMFRDEFLKLRNYLNSIK